MDQMNNENFDVTTKEEFVADSTATPTNEFVADSTVTPEIEFVTDSTVTPANDTKDGLCVTALVLGIVGFFINPAYICSILAIVFGAIGMKADGVNAGKAKVGLILGIVSIVLQFIADIIITICTLGAGGVSFCC